MISIIKLSTFKVALVDKRIIPKPGRGVSTKEDTFCVFSDVTGRGLKLLLVDAAN